MRNRRLAGSGDACGKGLLMAGLLGFAAIIAAPAPADAQQRAPEEFRDLVAVDAPVVALTNVKLIDGTGAPARTGQTVVIEGDRITAVGATGSVQVPAGAEVRDLSGHTLLPGLVGLHNHSYYTGGFGRAAQLSFSGSRLYLASGSGRRAPVIPTKS